MGYSILTNHHVLEDATSKYCTLNTDYTVVPASDFVTGHITISEIFQRNNSADEAIFPVEDTYALSGSQLVSIPASSLNYSISSLGYCNTKMPIGSPVVTVGFPAFGMQNESIYGMNITQSSMITSDGTISGYDDSATLPSSGLPYMNYFVSAKIDSGNSGGIAFSKNSNGLCVLGIPTWINTGNYANEGIVQNINNVMYQP